MRGSRGFTLVEILIVIAIIGVLVAMAAAGYRISRIRAGETAALAALEEINRAQFAFAQTCGNQRYAPTLVSLGVPVPGSGVAFLSPDLSQADPLSKSGYVISMSGAELDDVAAACTGALPVAAYQLTADPASPGVTGGRYYGTNTDRVIYEDAETFSGNMPETGAPAHGREIK